MRVQDKNIKAPKKYWVSGSKSFYSLCLAVGFYYVSQLQSQISTESYSANYPTVTEWSRTHDNSTENKIALDVLAGSFNQDLILYV